MVSVSRRAAGGPPLERTAHRDLMGLLDETARVEMSPWERLAVLTPSSPPAPPTAQEWREAMLSTVHDIGASE